MPFQELVEAALLEQYRWEFHCEALYRHGLQANPIDDACFSDMLKTFGVARTLSVNGRKFLKEKLPEIAKRHKANPDNWNDIFSLTSSKSKDLQDPGLYIEGSKLQNSQPRAFVSGLTKILWFAGSHNMPMYDTFTNQKVKPKGGSQAEKATNFYKELLNEWGYGDTYQRLAKIKKYQKVSWAFYPERFLDKLLLLKGIDPKKLKDDALMGTKPRRDFYLQRLSAAKRSELNELAKCLVETMAETQFRRKLAP